MKKGKVFCSMEHIDSDLIEEAETYKGTKKKNPWVKWGAMAACLCLVVVGVLSIHSAKPVHQIELHYNEVSSVMNGGVPASAKTETVESTTTEASEHLGYDIANCIPSAIDSYNLKYVAVQNTDTNEVLGVIITGTEDENDANCPGVWIEVSFGGTKPMIDYAFEYEKMVYSTVHGVEVCVTVTPQKTYTNASGEEKTVPAVYTATFRQGENYYYIESRGTFEQVVFDELVCTLVEAAAAK